MTETKLNKVAAEIYADVLLKGFDAKRENVGQSLMLIVSELSEALEAHRKDRFCKLDPLSKENAVLSDNNEIFTTDFECFIKDTFEDELADVQIRLLDLCGALKIDIDFHIEMKRKYNKTRQYKHNKKY